MQNSIDLALAAARDDIHDRAATRQRLARADNAVHAALIGDLPHDNWTTAELIATFTIPPFSYSMMSSPSLNFSQGADSLLLHLWRRASEPVASRLLPGMAVHAYRRGDEIAARIALEASASDSALAYALLTFLCDGNHPTEIFQFMNTTSEMFRNQTYL